MCVASDLSFESVERIEFEFGTKEVEEGDFDILTIEIFLEIEEMHFEETSGKGVFDGGTDADIGDGGDLAILPECFDGIDAVGRKLLVVGAQIGGGKAEGAS